MISFVWSSKYPFIAGGGGSENYTIGQMRELRRRGIDCRLISIGHDISQSKRDFPDIPISSLPSAGALEQLDDTIVFITYPLRVQTKHKSYVILHCPPPSLGKPDPLYDKQAFKGKKLIAVSGMGAGLWRRYLGFTSGKISIDYPFAEPAFATVQREPQTRDPIKLLFAGRLIHDKGIYTLMEALHLPQLKDLHVELTVTDAGSNTEDGDIIKRLCDAHPLITVVSSRKSADDMAHLMGGHDVLVAPTTNIYWRETFGMVSVEAQHAGCRVVASRAGGLPETNCGGLMLISPDNPLSLARGIAKAVKLGPMSVAERTRAAKHFTVAKSVDALLKTINYATKHSPLGQRALSVRLPRLSARQLSMFQGIAP